MMRDVSLSALVAGLISLTIIALIAIGPPRDHVPSLTPPPSGLAPSSITVAGFTLTSDSIDLPIDDQSYPDGLHADIVNANCTSCHSASMGLSQPPLSADQWKATVTKMKDVYKAPVADGDIPLIVDYLTALSARQDASSQGRAHKPDFNLTPDTSGGTG